MMQICSKEECSACGACINICPHNAIYLAENESGEEEIVINQELCIDCNQCKSVCQALHIKRLYDIKKCYAAWAIEDLDYESSSSGGVASLISKSFIQMGGMVYGAAFVESRFEHVRVENIEGLDALKGSKYVKSDTSKIYKKVKEDLLNDRKVLFIGTPCQIGGIRSFLKKEYSTLFTIDLICHGVPSSKYIFDYLKDLGLNDVSEIIFRKKKYILKVVSNQSVVYERRWNHDYYYSAFMYSLTHRDNCYQCEYSSPRRCGDVTLGDFHGLDKTTIRNYSTSRSFISVILVNSAKGKIMLDGLAEKCVIEERSIDEALKGNPQLNFPSRKHKDREKFLRDYKDKGFLQAVKSTSIGLYIFGMQIRWIILTPYRFFRYKVFRRQ